MTYQVLARKWRPRSFREMVGQEHVLQALINALDHDRLHHAYLFTGTRGVGKTTIARILAKCLNCETGVSSEPCGQCPSCVEIAEGRFVDLIEVDAASRTKVEDTRELLENVQYAPTRGRYKVYLIDEVHMLSGHSFNALLKTLEEPPPHVKFLLATTDPQKLPVTILSRCLQFNLKNMPPERIVRHLEFVLEKEMVPFEESALWQLGRAADGSMRDALSLTDQAIAFGSGKLTQAEVSAMLGTIDQSRVYQLLDALVAENGQALLTAVDEMSEQSPDFAGALAELLSILHRIAIAQALPEAVDNSYGDRERILQLAGQVPAEDIQLYYQTALLGRRDLPLAPDPRIGFEMTLLRMLAFKPQGVAELPRGRLPASGAAPRPSTPSANPVATGQPESQQAAPPSQPETKLEPQPEPAPPPKPEPEPEPQPAAQSVSSAEGNVSPKKPEAASAGAIKPPAETIALEQASPDKWLDIYRGLGADGMLQAIAAHCVLVSREGNQCHFVLDENNSSLYDAGHQQRLAECLGDYFGQTVKVAIAVGPVSAETPAAWAARQRSEHLAAARAAIDADPLVQEMKEHLAASVSEDSVEPVLPGTTPQ